MNKIKEFFADWSWKEKAWLAFVLIVQTQAWAIQKESLFMLVMTLTSSLNLVLGAKGKVAGLYFAIINSALYAINCMGIPLYGEVTYNLIYSIPVSAIAIFTWKKNMTKGGEVKFRTMSPKIMLTTAAVTIIGVLGYMQILKWMGGNLPFMDSLTTVVSVVASFLYLLRFSEQWAMWAIVNALSIVMWIMVFMQGDSSALLIIIMKTINFINSTYGFLNWRKNCKRNCIITDQNRGFYVKIIKDQEGHGFHVSMRSMAFFAITINQSYAYGKQVESKMTKYEIIKQEIKEQIEDNILKPNQVIKSENEMCQCYKVSRVTVRKAIDELCAEGILYRIKGKGCFVREQTDQKRSRIYSFTEAVKNEGKLPGKKQLSLEKKEADAYLADKLQIEEGEEVFEIRSLY